jgi:hypothetical protein
MAGAQAITCLQDLLWAAGGQYVQRPPTSAAEAALGAKLLGLLKCLFAFSPKDARGHRALLHPLLPLLAWPAARFGLLGTLKSMPARYRLLTLAPMGAAPLLCDSVRTCESPVARTVEGAIVVMHAIGCLHEIARGAEQYATLAPAAPGLLSEVCAAGGIQAAAAVLRSLKANRGGGDGDDEAAVCARSDAASVVFAVKLLNELVALTADAGSGLFAEQAGGEDRRDALVAEPGLLASLRRVLEDDAPGVHGAVGAVVYSIAFGRDAKRARCRGRRLLAAGLAAPLFAMLRCDTTTTRMAAQSALMQLIQGGHAGADGALIEASPCEYPAAAVESMLLPGGLVAGLLVLLSGREPWEPNFALRALTALADSGPTGCAAILSGRGVVKAFRGALQRDFRTLDTAARVAGLCAALAKLALPGAAPLAPAQQQALSGLLALLPPPPCCKKKPAAGLRAAAADISNVVS